MTGGSRGGRLVRRGQGRGRHSCRGAAVAHRALAVAHGGPGACAQPVGDRGAGPQRPGHRDGHGPLKDRAPRMVWFLLFSHDIIHRADSPSLLAWHRSAQLQLNPAAACSAHDREHSFFTLLDTSSTRRTHTVRCSTTDPSIDTQCPSCCRLQIQSSHAVCTHRPPRDCTRTSSSGPSPC